MCALQAASREAYSPSGTFCFTPSCQWSPRSAQPGASSSTAHERTGDRAVFFVDLHERTNRVIGSTKLGRYFDYEHEHFKPNHRVRVMVYGKNPSGLHLVVDGQYRGMAYHNEVHEELAVGEVRTAWVKEVREDGLLDISLQRLGHGATLDARDVILQALEEDGGFLPLHDKADPAAIRKRLSMSKGVFKKAIGGLYRDGKIRLEPGGIRLSERGR